MHVSKDKYVLEGRTEVKNAFIQDVVKMLKSMGN